MAEGIDLFLVEAHKILGYFFFFLASGPFRLIFLLIFHPPINIALTLLSTRANVYELANHTKISY